MKRNFDDLFLDEMGKCMRLASVFKYPIRCMAPNKLRLANEECSEY